MSHTLNCEPLKAPIRTVPDFPKPGILFYDITTLLKDKIGFAELTDALAAHYIGKSIDLVLAIEARGFIFGPALAYRLNAGFVPVRKPRKLPAPVARVTYDLEYGTDSLEIHLDAIEPARTWLSSMICSPPAERWKRPSRLGSATRRTYCRTGICRGTRLLRPGKVQDYDVFSLLHYNE